MSEEQRPIRLVDRREPRRVSTPILVVEDDPQPRVMFQLLLESEGHPVVTTADGLEALRCARTMRPSLVILDLELPLLGGHEVAAKLRASHGEAPTTTTSAPGTSRSAIETRGSVASSVASKPSATKSTWRRSSGSPE